MTISINNPIIPSAYVGVPYELELTAITEEIPTWSLVSGSLPPGLSLSEEGIISGIPTMWSGSDNERAFIFTVEAATPLEYSDEEQFTIVVFSFNTVRNIDKFIDDNLRFDNTIDEEIYFKGIDGAPNSETVSSFYNRVLGSLVMPDEEGNLEVRFLIDTGEEL